MYEYNQPDLSKEKYIRYGIPAIKEHLPELFKPKPTEAKPVIAVVDGGIRHDNRNYEIFKNPAEKLDGTDTDKNGYVDDIEGYNFAKYNNDTSRTGGHAGQVARILTECNPNILRLLDVTIRGKASPTHWSGLSGLIYAGIMKCVAANFSYVTDSNTMFAYAIEKMAENDCVLLATTANSRVSLSEDYKYPASIVALHEDRDPSKPLRFNNILVTAPITLDHKIVAQWDKEQVLVLGYAGASSWAAPIAGNLIATMKYLEPSLTSGELVDLVCQGATQYSELEGKSKFGVINYKSSIEKLLGKKLESVSSPAPEPIEYEGPEPIKEERPIKAPPTPPKPIIRTVKEITFKYNNNKEKTFLI